MTPICSLLEIVAVAYGIVGVRHTSVHVVRVCRDGLARETVRVFGRPEELAERLEASGYDIPASEIEAGMELHLPCLVKVGQGHNGYKNIEAWCCLRFFFSRVSSPLVAPCASIPWSR